MDQPNFSLCISLEHFWLYPSSFRLLQLTSYSQSMLVKNGLHTKHNLHRANRSLSFLLPLAILSIL